MKNFFKRFVTIAALVGMLGLGGVIGCETANQQIVRAPLMVNVVAPSTLHIANGKAYLEMDSISPYMLDDLEDSLLYMSTHGIKDLTITMCNPGGMIVHMWAIYDLLEHAKDRGMQLTTSARGLIASASVPIFLLGDHREITKNSYIMVHPHSGVIHPGNPPSVNKMFEEWTGRYAKIVADKTTLTYEEALELVTGNQNSKAYYMNAEEALSKNFVHKIIQ